MQKLQKTLEVVLSVILVLHLISPIFFSKIFAANELTINLLLADNVFANQNISNTHSRRFLGVGNFYDTTDGNYYATSQTYLKFDLSSIPSNAIVKNAQLSLKRYANGGSGFNAYVARLTQNFDGNTGRARNDYKTFTGKYDEVYVDQNDWDFKDFRWNVTNLVKEWRSGISNYGLAVVANNPLAYSGAAFCSSRSDGFCKDQHDPLLIVTYTLNQSPYTPNLTSPTNLSEFSGNCDLSLNLPSGNCSILKRIELEANGVGDPDQSPGDLDYSQFYFTRENSGTSFSFSSNNVYGSGIISYAQNFEDGMYSWKVRSKDKLGVWGNYSTSSQFIYDSTPPAVPDIINLKEFSGIINSQGVPQILVESSVSSDNISSGDEIMYLLEYSPSQDFLKIFTKDWQISNIFEIPESGADSIIGTEDDLTDESKLYFRIKAKDKLNNISYFSEVKSTTIDTTLPEVSNFKSDLTRFSPNNSTSVGSFDQLEVAFNYIETNPNLAKIEIYNSENNVVRSLSQSISDVSSSINFIWNGKNDGDIFLPDGIYKLTAKVEDKAGNINNSVPEIFITIDNSEANIKISTPYNNYWTNNELLSISGQIRSPRDASKSDDDILNAIVINLTNNSSSQINWDTSDIFEINQNKYPELFPLSVGENKFTFKTEDTVANIQTNYFDSKSSSNKSELIINLDNLSPKITSVTPQGLINSRFPKVEFIFEDFGGSDLPVGINNENYKVSLNQDVLFNEGINLQPSLISDLNCEALSSTNLKNYKNSSSKVKCSFNFISEIIPDGEYNFNIYIKDNAGNSTENLTTFNLDSNNYLEINSPVDKSTLTSSSIFFEGKTVKNTTLKLSNSTLGLSSKSYTVSEELSTLDPNEELLDSLFEVKCGEFLDIDLNSQTPEEEICRWKVKVKQSYAIKDIDKLNNINITSTDEALNSISKTINLNINLHSYEISTKSDLNYFSPNGDGNQDSIIFSNSVKNTQSENYPPEIVFYSLEIKDTNSNVIRQLSDRNYVPSSIYWDGKDSNNSFIKDGEYTYILTVETSDGIVKETLPKPLYAFTTIADQVIITSPADGFVTSDGVIYVQGQAPVSSTEIRLLRGVVEIDLCINYIDIDDQVLCDLNVTTVSNDQGYFSAIVALPIVNLEKKSHYQITAKARDQYGNQTNNSNLVNVEKDTVDPFEWVNITPALTGINSEDDYTKFLNGEINIDQIRSVIVDSYVSQNTEQVELSFKDYTNNLQSLIGTLTNQKETNSNLNPNNLDNIKKLNKVTLGDSSIDKNNCVNAYGCLWTYNLPISPQYGGIYEVVLKGKKAEIIQQMGIGFKVDGSIPAAPIFLSVEKETKDSWFKLSSINNKYYSNSRTIKLKGAAEPKTTLKLFENGNPQSTLEVPNTGYFEFIVNLDNQKSSFLFTLQSTDGQNIVEGSNSLEIIFDDLSPKLESISRKSTNPRSVEGWAKTGDLMNFTVSTNEDLLYADLIKPDGYIKYLTNVSVNNWNSSINIDSPNEGFFYPTVKLVDYATNQNLYDSKIDEDLSSGDFRVFIDNTSPDISSILKNNWSKDIFQGGINADGIYPEIGRTNPGYVTKSSNILIKGFAEKGQRIELSVNNSEYITQNVSGSNCEIKNSDKLSMNGLIVKSGVICEWEIDYKFKDKGVNDIYGVPTHGYNFQVRVYDKADNRSQWSNSVLAYHDTQSPVTPDFINVSSGSYNPIPNKNITKDLKITIESLAERSSDLEYELLKPDSTKTKFEIFQNTLIRSYLKNFEIGTQSDNRLGCIKNINGRSTGICEDGIYKFNLNSTDAAGNTSEVSSISIERDTVPPFIPTVSEPYLCGQNICIDIVGEPNSQIFVNGQSNSLASQQSTTKILKYSWNYDTEYSFEIYLQDRALNNSETVVKSIKTPEEFLAQGGILGTTVSDKYGDWNSSKFGTIYLEILVKNNEHYILTSNIPTPILTFLETNHDDSFTLNGASINQAQNLHLKIYKEYSNKYESEINCEVGIFIDSREYECLSSELGLDYNDYLYEINSRCGFVIPFYTSFCLHKEYSKNRIENLFLKSHSIKTVTVNIFNAKNNVVLDNFPSTVDGKFQTNIKLDDKVNVGDKVNSSLKLELVYEFQKQPRQVVLETGKSNHFYIDKSDFINHKGRKSKIINVPYFNQWLELDSTKYPSDGWQMCGAASATMVAGFFNKLNYDKSNMHDLKKYMYSDQGMNLGNPCEDSNKSGTFAITQYNCNMNYKGGIQKYLNKLNLAVEDLGWAVSDINIIKKSIDEGYPIIYSYGKLGTNFGHIAVIVGYTEYDEIIVNDPFTDTLAKGLKWSDYWDGYRSVYKLNDPNFPKKYFLKVKN